MVGGERESERKRPKLYILKKSSYHMPIFNEIDRLACCAIMHYLYDDDFTTNETTTKESQGERERFI